MRSLSSALAWGSTFFLPPERGRREGLGPGTVAFLPNRGLSWWEVEGELANRLRLSGLKEVPVSLNMCLKTLSNEKGGGGILACLVTLYHMTICHVKQR